MPKTADVVASALRREIIRNELYNEDRLPTEAELMARYGVSRPSLREALRVLESEQLIVVRRGHQGGVRACRPDIAVAANYLGLVMQAERVTLADVFGARTAIEPQAVRSIAESRHRARSVAELRELQLREQEIVDDAEAYAAAVTHFHQRLVELAENKTLALVWGALQHVIAGEVKDLRARLFGPATRARRAEGVEHGLQLIEAGEADAAEEFWRTQMIAVSRRVVERHGGKTVIDVLGD